MDVLERAEFEVKTFGNPSKESGLKLIAEVTRLRQLLPETEQREKEAKTSWAFAEGDLVRKKSGSWWEGFVVGTYSTMQTPRGYAVQLAHEFGPVQIYPESALELAFTPMSEAELVDALSAMQSEER
ncbi:hypothetical protein G6L13_05380 [Agrobacterium tumefaciens]|uniref:hypothetical protein n=1 Tax=Agrobacterium tumefaciens TaxID=358 RepID=UPI001573E5F6|nr:hypothetical protein [Agrobacterium tumefaciens]NTA79916.1 hypothetical protein [Agrobacterium tumefaciens]